MSYNDKAIAFYAANDDGTFDELIVDVYNRHYALTYDVKERYLWKSHDKKAKEFLVERDLFYAYYDIIKHEYSGEIRDSDYYYESDAEEKIRKPIIPKERVWQAIKFELDEQELDKLTNFDVDFAKDDYYDFDVILNNVHTVMNGEKSIEYFKTWCIVMMRCFMHYTSCRSKKLKELYYDLGDYFDGVAFMDTELEGEKKLKEFREIIAELKHSNHEINDCKNKTNTDFETNGVITYVTFAFSLNDGKECLYKVCIVDNNQDKINYFFVEEPDYLEKINYTFLSEADFDDLSSRYFYSHSLDTSLTIDHALKVKG